MGPADQNATSAHQSRAPRLRSAYPETITLLSPRRIVPDGNVLVLARARRVPVTQPDSEIIRFWSTEQTHSKVRSNELHHGTLSARQLAKLHLDESDGDFLIVLKVVPRLGLLGRLHTKHEDVIIIWLQRGGSKPNYRLSRKQPLDDASIPEVKDVSTNEQPWW